jgi:hypothetical protein
LQASWGLSTPELALVDGVRVTLELEDGTRIDVRGVLLREDADAYVLQAGGREVHVPRTRVVGVEKEPQDPRDIWTPEQLVTRLLARLPTVLSARDHFRVAEYARAVGAFQAAREHYAASARSGEPSARTARRRLDEVESLLQAQDALTALREIRNAAAQRAFRRARARMKAFLAAHPDADEAVAAERIRTERVVSEARRRFFEIEAKIRFPKIVLRAIRSRVREADVGMRDVTVWARTLPASAFRDLAEQLGRWDDVSPEEARILWANRPKSSWRTATYGSGTFIVEPPKSGRAAKSASGSAPTLPTRDAWWAAAAPPERASWLMASFAETSGLFEISSQPLRSPCPVCGGEGTRTQRLSTGALAVTPCTRCGGARTDKRVRYR